MVRWNVYLKGKLINGVHFTQDCNAHDVKIALVKRDGYDNNIIVKRVRGLHPKI